MLLDRQCPNCEHNLPLGSIQFSEDHAVLCSYCGKPILAVSAAMENQITSKNTTKSRSATQDYYNQQPINRTINPVNKRVAGHALNYAHGVHGDEHVDVRHM